MDQFIRVEAGDGLAVLDGVKHPISDGSAVVIPAGTKHNVINNPDTEEDRKQQTMTNYQYLIIGGGMTAAAAADGIREVDSTGAIGLISGEPDAPYNRPPLSKALWKGEPLETIWRKAENRLVEIHLGRVVKEIVPEQKRVVDDKGDVFTYEKLLLATGGRLRPTASATAFSNRRSSSRLCMMASPNLAFDRDLDEATD